jgi:hypothetical protein
MISHHHKAIFVHIPKCAGQSVETVFLNDLGLTWETRAPLLLRPNDQETLGPPRLAHLTAAEYVGCRYTPKSMFDAYYRFAVVRDPWARTVSLYKHLDLNLTFREFVLDWLPGQFASRAWKGSYWFVRPQCDFVMSDGVQLVEKLLRFERLAEEFATVATVLGLGAPLPHINRSGNRPSRGRRWRGVLGRQRRNSHQLWTDYYDGETVSGIERLYAADAKAFGYSPPGGAAR